MSPNTATWPRCAVYFCLRAGEQSHIALYRTDQAVLCPLERFLDLGGNGLQPSDMLPWFGDGLNARSNQPGLRWSQLLLSFSSTLLFFVSASNPGRLIAAGQDQDVWVLLYKGGERQGWMCAWSGGRSKSSNWFCLDTAYGSAPQVAASALGCLPLHKWTGQHCCPEVTSRCSQVRYLGGMLSAVLCTTP